MMTVKVAGGTIKTGPGIPLNFPNGGTDAVFENTPYQLPQTDNYVIEITPTRCRTGRSASFR